MTDLGALVDSRILRFERLLPGPIERVWDYLTKPGPLASWLADGEIDLRPGGRVELRFNVEEVPERRDEGSFVRGVVRRSEPPRLLAYTWTAPGAAAPASADLVAEPLVTFEMEMRGENVRLVLTHQGLDCAALSKCGAGWHTHLGILAARLNGAPPEPFLPVFHRLVPVYEKKFAAPLSHAASTAVAAESPAKSRRRARRG